MNRFLTHEGGQPIWLDDIDFIQESVRGTIGQMIRGMTGESDITCIVAGCEAQETGISAGVVCVNGEILLFDGSYRDPNDSEFAVESMESGERMTKSGSKVNSYESRKAILTPTEGGTVAARLPHLAELLSRGRKIIHNDSIQVYLHGNTLSVNGKIKSVSDPAGGGLDQWYPLSDFYVPAINNNENRRTLLIPIVLDDINDGATFCVGRAQWIGDHVSIYLDRYFNTAAGRTAYFQFNI